MVKKIVKTAYLASLKVLAKLELAKHKNATIIGITGSSGKTSCKEMVVAFLKPHFKNALKYTVKGNSETGIPYEILNIPVRHYKMWEYPMILLKGLSTVLFNFRKFDVFVIEYGIDGPKAPLNMDHLLSIVKPNIALLLSISAVHGENFEQLLDDSIPAAKKVEAVERLIAQEKFKLLQAVADKKKAYLSVQAASKLDSASYQRMSILDSVLTPRISEWENSSEGLTFTLSNAKGDITTTLPEVVLPKSAQLNILFAAIVTVLLKKDIRTSLSKLSENYKVEPGRSSLLPGVNNTLIIDSSYNANPLAAKELFPLVKEVAKKGRRKKVIVLGDFRELGKGTEELYRSIIKEAAKNADVLVLTNELMKLYGIPAAEEAGMIFNENVYWFENGRQLSFHITEVVEDKSVVLFEGSQNEVFLEYAVKELCQNKDPRYLLTHIPRMSRDWLEIK